MHHKAFGKLDSSANWTRKVEIGNVQQVFDGQNKRLLKINMQAKFTFHQSIQNQQSERKHRNGWKSNRWNQVKLWKTTCHQK
jgi:hypothetical protein